MIETIQELVLASGLNSQTIRAFASYRKGTGEFDSMTEYKCHSLVSKTLREKNLIATLSPALKNDLNIAQ
jgi:hypothetical protein